jgi:hypothetical protein
MQDWDKVARAFAGGKPSTEFIKDVANAGFEVGLRLASPRKVGPAVDLREALRKILKAVQSAKGQLSKLDDRILSFHLESAEKTAQRLLDEPPPPPKRRGRPARKGLSGATCCAIYAGALWRNVRGKWPANNIEFRRACAALYAEAGGGDTDAEQKDGFWRGHWRKAEPQWRRREKNSKKVEAEPARSAALGRKAPSALAETLAELEAFLSRRNNSKYFTLISRAVAGLEKNSGEARRAVYERARGALLAHLRGMTPALNESDITRERLAMEEAIRKVEAESARSAVAELEAFVLSDANKLEALLRRQGDGNSKQKSDFHPRHPLRRPPRGEK